MEEGAVSTTSADIPRSALAHGFRIKPTGTHLSSTIKLQELRMLLASCPVSTDLPAYRSAVIDNNLLSKPSASARNIAFDRLKELFALDPAVLLFRALRDLWDADYKAQPLLALLCATARDPILRAMTPYLLGLEIGSRVSPEALSAEADRQFPNKFVASSLKRLGRNAASSWEQAGLLTGHQTKERSRPESSSATVTYALLLGDLCGRRGQVLFNTLWAQMLDVPQHILHELAVHASQRGWMEYRASGDVVEVSFRHLMRED